MQQGNKINSSVFSGVTRNSLSFDQIMSLYGGNKITIDSRDRFFKSMKYLHIKIKNVNISITKCSDKKIINNTYIPINIINSENNNRLIRLLKKILTNIKFIIKNI